MIFISEKISTLKQNLGHKLCHQGEGAEGSLAPVNLGIKNLLETQAFEELYIECPQWPRVPSVKIFKTGLWCNVGKVCVSTFEYWAQILNILYTCSITLLCLWD